MGNIWEKIGKKDVQSLERIHFFFGGETIFEDKPKENARPGHVRSSYLGPNAPFLVVGSSNANVSPSPKAGDFARFARFFFVAQLIPFSSFIF